MTIELTIEFLVNSLHVIFLATMAVIAIGILIIILINLDMRKKREELRKNELIKKSTRGNAEHARRRSKRSAVGLRNRRGTTRKEAR